MVMGISSSIGSIISLFSSTGASSIFFKPVHFGFKLAYLLVELRRYLFVVFGFLLAMIAKYIRNFIQQSLSPLTNLIHMYFVLAGNLGHCFIRLQCLQRHHGLECRIVSIAHVACHLFSPFFGWQAIMHQITLSSFWGVLYNFLKSFFKGKKYCGLPSIGTDHHLVVLKK